MSLRDDILGAVAANLRDFGYPDARADNITTTKLFAMFAGRQIEEFAEKHGSNREVAKVCDSILADIEKVIGDA